MTEKPNRGHRQHVERPSTRPFEPDRTHGPNYITVRPSLFLFLHRAQQRLRGFCGVID